MVKIVDLINKEAGIRKGFRFDHAVKLLTYEAARKLSLWVLPDDSNYIFKDGKLIESRRDKMDKKPPESKRDTEGEAQEGTA